jgi:hypothetical protein
MAESPATRMMRSHALIPNTQTQTIVMRVRKSTNAPCIESAQAGKHKAASVGMKKTTLAVPFLCGSLHMRISVKAQKRQTTSNEHYRL